MALVSVIIPNYNHYSFLKQRIESVLNQTFQDIEVIILDDCSTDNSKEIIEHYRNHPKVSSIIYNDTNSGSTFRQWKKGLELANGLYIWIAESDDYCTENFLENAVKKLSTDLNNEIYFCQSFVCNEKNEIVGDLHVHTDLVTYYDWYNEFETGGKQFIEKALLTRNVIANASAVIFKRENGIINIDKILNYKMCGDWLFWSLLLSQGGKVIYYPIKENYFRSHLTTTRVFNDIEKAIRFKVEEFSVISKLLKSINIKNQLWLDDLWREIVLNTGIKRIFLLLKLTENLLEVNKLTFFSQFIFIHLSIRTNNTRINFGRIKRMIFE